MDKDKGVFRREVLLRRKNMDSAECGRNSAKICRRLLECDWYPKVQTVLVYASIRQEVVLTDFVEQAWKDGRDIFFPKTFGEQMEFYRVNAWSELEPGNFSVPEPADTAEDNRFAGLGNDAVLPAVVLVPGVVFSGEGNRIGYGKGYYDRYLARWGGMLYPIGIAHELQLRDFAAQEHDIRMKRIVTEKREVVLDDEFGRIV